MYCYVFAISLKICLQKILDIDLRNNTFTATELLSGQSEFENFN